MMLPAWVEKFARLVAMSPHINNFELGQHGRNRSNVWDYASVNVLTASARQELAAHPTSKPVATLFSDVRFIPRSRHPVVGAEMSNASGTKTNRSGHLSGSRCVASMIIRMRAISLRFDLRLTICRSWHN
jgi:hypothetical protein